MNEKEMQYPLRHQLAGLHTRWIAHANEAQKYKELYEEANLFVNRAIERLPEDHPLNPYNYKGLVSDEYLSQLASVFVELDAVSETVFDPELDEFIGIEEVPLTDIIDKVPDRRMMLGQEPSDEATFSISDWNTQVMEDARSATEGKSLTNLKEIKTNEEKEEDTDTGIVEVAEVSSDATTSDIEEEESELS